MSALNLLTPRQRELLNLVDSRDLRWDGALVERTPHGFRPFCPADSHETQRLADIGLVERLTDDERVQLTQLGATVLHPYASFDQPSPRRSRRAAASVLAAAVLGVLVARVLLGLAQGGGWL